MDVDAIWHLDVDLLEKVEKLSRSVALVALADHKSGCDVEGREQRCRTMADVGMGPALRNTGRHRQDGLFAIESLDLALLVDAENQRSVGR